MKKILFYLLLSCTGVTVCAQTAKTELYDLIKKLLYDSTGYENVGDWAVGKPTKFPVKWKSDRIEMSDDTSINFFRMGTANISINGRTFTHNNKPLTWNIMLKGPRMGYGSFSIISSASAQIVPGYTLDSVFGKRPFRSTVIKGCTGKPIGGYYYYELKLPKKDVAYIKLSWLSVDGNTAIRIDGYDAWSKYAVKLDCPK